jgi:glycosyltransferase involved in cell wall biosynthesis
MGASTSARLALFLPTMDDGGAEAVMLRLGAGFAARGHEVDLVIGVPGGPLEAQIPPVLRIVQLEAKRSAMSLPRLVRYLQKEKPRAMLSTLEHANILAVWASRLARTNARVVLREANVLLPKGEMHGVRPHVLRALMRRFYRSATRIVAVSKSVEESITEGLALPRSLVRTIYNPIVAPDLAKKAAEPLPNEDDAWFAPGAPPVVLSVGRLAAQKDFATLLRAFAVARKERNARLVILGEGKERGALEALARELGVEADVRMPGFVANPLRFMNRSPVFVLSSIYEGLPGVLIQAMACGCRVISTDCPGGSREILEGALAPHGALVPMRDPKSLGRAMVAAMDDATKNPARVKHAVDRFTDKAAIDGYLAELGAASRAHANVNEEMN